MKNSLRARIALGLSIYTLLLSAGLLGIGYSVHETLERMVWRAQLDGEMAGYLRQRALRHDAALPGSGRLKAFVAEAHDRARASIPAELRDLAPGMHDDIDVDGVESAVMVRDVGSARVYMLLDIEALEEVERMVAVLLTVATLAGIGVLVLAVWWMSGRLVHPVSELARAVDRLDPAAGTQRLPVDAGSTTEVRSIAEAMNRLLDRAEESLQRERTFVNTMSHELRTPIAVIAGAAELAEREPALPDRVRRQLQRIAQSAQGVAQLVRLLLILAKAPERLREADDIVMLERLLPEIVADHRHLLHDKAVRLDIGALVAGSVRAPQAIVQIAISNLLRNAIENSDRGSVQISLESAGVVRIRDSGRGMNPEEIAALYAAMARGDRSSGPGIGLPLIARICDHLSWRLQVEPVESGPGTVVTLDLSASLVALPALTAD